MTATERKRGSARRGNAVSPMENERPKSEFSFDKYTTIISLLAR